MPGLAPTPGAPPAVVDVPPAAADTVPADGATGVVPPPTLPEAGEKDTISSDSVKVTDPAAFPLLFTQTETSRSPAGPSSSVQVMEEAEAAVTEHFLPPTSTSKSVASSVNPEPSIVRTTEPSTRALETAEISVSRLES